MTPHFYEPRWGSDVSVECVRLVELAASKGEPATMRFNDVDVLAQPDSDPVALAAYYLAECDRRCEVWLASPEYAEQQRQAADVQRRREDDLAAALCDAPTSSSMRDPTGWAEVVRINSDGYSAGVVRYAEKWACLMEGAVARGETVAACAERTSHLADDEGITGFMYGCAASLLCKFWSRGEELAAWRSEGLMR